MSIEVQKDYYPKYIASHPNWEYVGLYADEGMSGTSCKRREEFNCMISDAINGNFDLIITKSISRFARNTVDTLSAIRRLKEAGVEVFFEKEQIFSFDSKGEFMLTLLSSIAQIINQILIQRGTLDFKGSFLFLIMNDCESTRINEFEPKSLKVAPLLVGKKDSGAKERRAGMGQKRENKCRMLPFSQIPERNLTGKRTAERAKRTEEQAVSLRCPPPILPNYTGVLQLNYIRTNTDS